MSFLVAVDADSKWPEVFPLVSTTAGKTIEVLHQLFSSYGFPEEIVLDNGPQFTADEFSRFTRANRVTCGTLSSRLGRAFCSVLQKYHEGQQNSDLTLTHRLANFLWTYRSTPHATTGVSLSSLFLRRHMRTRFDMMRPDPAVTVNQQQSRQKAHDRRAHCREFLVRQSVMVRNLRPGPGWIPGVIVERLGPVSYLVETSDHLL